MNTGPLKNRDDAERILRLLTSGEWMFFCQKVLEPRFAAAEMALRKRGQDAQTAEYWRGVMDFIDEIRGIAPRILKQIRPADADYRGEDEI